MTDSEFHHWAAQDAQASHFARLWSRRQCSLLVNEAGWQLQQGSCAVLRVSGKAWQAALCNEQLCVLQAAV